MPTKTSTAAAAASDKEFTLPPLDKGVMTVTVIGNTPLIVHAWSHKAKKEMLDKQTKVAKPAREAKDPMKDFEDSLYRLEGGGYGFPSVGFKSAAVTACTSVAGITKVAARQAFHIIGEPVDIKMAFNGGVMRTNMVRILGSEPQPREDMVRVGMGTADIRYRGQFPIWYAELDVQFNRNVLSEAQILNLLNVAGFAVGVGEWRPEKEGESGTFHVAEAHEIKAIRAGRFDELFPVAVGTAPPRRSNPVRKVA